MHSPVARVLAGLAATFALALGGIVAVPAAPATPAYQCSHFVLYKGWQGSCVRHLQTLLRGPDNLSSTVWTGGLAVDGSFGPLTEKAVRRFQSGMGIQVDGRFGPQSWRTICSIGFGGGGPLTSSQLAWQRAYGASC